MHSDIYLYPCLPMVYLHCAISEIALCYIRNCFGVVRLCSSGFDSQGGMSDLGRCAFSSIHIYISMSDQGISTLCYIQNCFGVVGLCSSGFNS